MFIFLTEINGDNRTRNSMNDILFEDAYFIIVNNKTIFKIIDTKKMIDEIWYIV